MNETGRAPRTDAGARPAAAALPWPARADGRAAAGRSGPGMPTALRCGPGPSR